LVNIGLLEYGLKFGEDCSPLKKTAVKKQWLKKKNFKLFSPLKRKYFELFLLVSIVKFFEDYDKKRKKSKNIFLTVKQPLVIYFTLVILTAPTVYSRCKKFNAF
jgi:hypothetical protein